VGGKATPKAPRFKLALEPHARNTTPLPGKLARFALAALSELRNARGANPDEPTTRGGGV
jgi:hypothetical protein